MSIMGALKAQIYQVGQLNTAMPTQMTLSHPEIVSISKMMTNTMSSILIRPVTGIFPVKDLIYLIHMVVQEH